MTRCSVVVKNYSIPFQITTSIFFVISAIILSNYVYRYVQTKKAKKSKNPPKLLFYSGLVFFTLSTLDFIVLIPDSISWCDESIPESTMIYLGGFFYINLQDLMIFIYVLRVYKVFKGSIYAASKCVKWTYIVIHSFIFIGHNVGIAENTFIYSEFGIIFVSFLTLMYMLLNLTVIGYFIYKLVRVYKAAKSEDKTIISTITKVTILSVASTIMTMLVLITFSLYKISDIYEGICRFLAMLDRFTNFIFTAMSYRDFESLYFMICGCMDNKCRICWAKIVKADEEFIMKQIHHDTDMEKNFEHNSSLNSDDIPPVDLVVAETQTHSAQK